MADSGGSETPGSAQARATEAKLSEAQKASLDKCRERNRLHARRSRQRKKAAQSGMLHLLERRRADLKRFDALLLRFVGVTFEEHLAREGSEGKLASVRRRLEDAGDELAAPPGSDGTPTPLAADASAEERVARSRERNRLHARRSRQRKKLLMESLKEQCDACAADVTAARRVLVAAVGEDHPEVVKADQVVAASERADCASPSAAWPSNDADEFEALSTGKRARDAADGGGEPADPPRSRRPRRAAAQRAVISISAGRGSPDSDSAGLTERTDASASSSGPPSLAPAGAARRSHPPPTSRPDTKPPQPPASSPPLGHFFARFPRPDLGSAAPHPAYAPVPGSAAGPPPRSAGHAFYGMYPGPGSRAAAFHGHPPTSAMPYAPPGSFQPPPPGMFRGAALYPHYPGAQPPHAAAGEHPRHALAPPLSASIGLRLPRPHARAVSESEAAMCLISLGGARPHGAAPPPPASAPLPVARSVEAAMAHTGRMLEWRR